MVVRPATPEDSRAIATIHVLAWLKENAGAQVFYRSNGFVVDGIEKMIEVGGTELVEIRLRKGLDGGGTA